MSFKFQLSNQKLALATKPINTKKLQMWNCINERKCENEIESNSKQKAVSCDFFLIKLILEKCIWRKICYHFSNDNHLIKTCRKKGWLLFSRHQLKKDCHTHLKFILNLNRSMMKIFYTYKSNLEINSVCLYLITI